MSVLNRPGELSGFLIWKLRDNSLTPSFPTKWVYVSVLHFVSIQEAYSLSILETSPMRKRKRNVVLLKYALHYWSPVSSGPDNIEVKLPYIDYIPIPLLWVLWERKPGLEKWIRLLKRKWIKCLTLPYHQPFQCNGATRFKQITGFTFCFKRRKNINGVLWKQNFLLFSHSVEKLGLK